MPARPSLGPPRGLPRKPSSFSRLINNFVSPDEPTSVTGGDTLFGNGIAAPKRPHIIEDRSDHDLNLRRHDWRFGPSEELISWSCILYDPEGERAGDGDAHTAREAMALAAITPGAVILENELIQFIQYQPLTETVSERPLVIIPPAINKFYVLDLQLKAAAGVRRRANPAGIRL